MRLILQSVCFVWRSQDLPPYITVVSKWSDSKYKYVYLNSLALFTQMTSTSILKIQTRITFPWKDITPCNHKVRTIIIPGNGSTTLDSSEMFFFSEVFSLMTVIDVCALLTRLWNADPLLPTLMMLGIICSSGGCDISEMSLYRIGCTVTQSHLELVPFDRGCSTNTFINDAIDPKR